MVLLVPWSSTPAALLTPSLYACLNPGNTVVRSVTRRGTPCSRQIITCMYAAEQTSKDEISVVTIPTDTFAARMSSHVSSWEWETYQKGHSNMSKGVKRQPSDLGNQLQLWGMQMKLVQFLPWWDGWLHYHREAFYGIYFRPTICVPQFVSLACPQLNISWQSVTLSLG